VPQTLDALNDSPSPTPSRSGLRLGFLPATPDDLPSSQPPSPESPSPESAEDLSASAGGWDDESEWSSLDADSSARTSESPSDAEAVDVELFDEDDLQEFARAGVKLGGEKAHELLATTPGKQAAGLMLTDEKDQAQIGDPLARIAARHAGDVGGKVNPDTRDLLASLVGLASYGVKQIGKVSEARRLDAGAAGLAGSPQPMPQAVDL
jgi:hypothetical protein